MRRWMEDHPAAAVALAPTAVLVVAVILNVVLHLTGVNQ